MAAFFAKKGKSKMGPFFESLEELLKKFKEFLKRKEKSPQQTGNKSNQGAGTTSKVTPKKRNYQHGQSEGGPGTWERRTTPPKGRGGDYQRKVTGAPKDTEYVVKTNRMKSGEKKFDGYDPETNTLIDAKDWTDWPPNGNSKFDQMMREKEIKNIKKDAQIALDNGANLEYHVPSEMKRQQLLEMLGDEIPSNFDIIVTN